MIKDLYTVEEKLHKNRLGELKERVFESQTSKQADRATVRSADRPATFEMHLKRKERTSRM